MSRFRRSTRLLAFATGIAVPIPAAAADAPLTLEGYCAIVLRAHPATRAGRALASTAAAESRSARLLSDPTLEVSFGRARPAGGGGEPRGESGASLSQTIPWLPARSASIAAADRAADALRAEAETTRRDLIADARLAFRRLQETRALAEVAGGAEADARSLSELVARRAEVGEGREVDRIKARVEWLRQERERSAAARQARAAEAVVRALAVEPLPDPLVIDASPSVGSAARPHDGPAGENPALAKARAEAARSEALLSFARRSRVPDLALSLFGEKELDRKGWGVTLGITLPLWGAKRGEIARAGAAAELARAEAERARVALARSLEERQRDVDVAAGEAEVLANELVPAAAESLRIARLLFEEGETSLLDLLDAQRTARDARREEIRARFALASAQVELERLMGAFATESGDGK